jgi:hypothetical protein
MFEAIKYVAGPFALLAFLAAAISLAYWRKLRVELEQIGFG